MSGDIKESFFERTSLDIKPYKEGFRLYLKTPEQDWIVGKTSFLTRLFSVVSNDDAMAISVTLDINIPEQYSIVLENKYGDVKAEDLNGEISIDNTSGEINLIRSSGEADLNNRYAETYVKDFDGNLGIKSTSSQIELNDINGDVEIEASY